MVLPVSREDSVGIDLGDWGLDDVHFVISQGFQISRAWCEPSTDGWEGWDQFVDEFRLPCQTSFHILQEDFFRPNLFRRPGDGCPVDGLQLQFNSYYMF